MRPRGAESNLQVKKVLNARLLDLRDTLLGAFKEAKEDPPKPPAASESDEDSSEGESSEEEAARHRKPAAGRAHHDLKALLDRANAARSEATAAVKRAEETREAARVARIMMKDPSPKTSKATPSTSKPKSKPKHDVEDVSDDSEVEGAQEQTGGLEQSLLRSLINKVELLSESRGGPSKGASPDTEASTLALIADAKSEQEKQARDLHSTPFTDFGNKEKAKSLSTLAISQGVMNNGLGLVGAAIADVIGDGDCPPNLLSRLGAMARSVDLLQTFNTKFMEETERAKQVTVLGDIYGHDYTQKLKALFNVTYNGDHANWTACVDAATRMFKSEGGRGGGGRGGFHQSKAWTTTEYDTGSGSGGKGGGTGGKGNKKKKKGKGDGSGGSN